MNSLFSHLHDSLLANTVVSHIAALLSVVIIRQQTVYDAVQKHKCGLCSLSFEEWRDLSVVGGAQTPYLLVLPLMP